MKIYKVKVNGKVYEVELESVTENEAKVEAPKQQEAPKPAQVSDGTGTVLKAPLQGTILKIKFWNLTSACSSVIAPFCTPRIR